MTWVKRDPPGDSEYFCNSPPCPFCFVWVAEARERPRGKKIRIESGRSVALRFVPFALTGLAFVLVIALRHERSLDAPGTQVVGPATAAVRSVLPAWESAPPVAASTPAAAAPPAAGPAPAAPADSGAGAAPVATSSEPPRNVPVSFRFAPDPSSSAAVVTVRNMSPQPQDLTVTAVDPRTGNRSTVLVNVAGHAIANLSEAGLVASHGWQLTVESQGYLTRTGVPVP
ncbi:MAG: hypothetical protein JO203_12265 [Gammaproteobacteria bacterium]|nr:hypothetical protein [Gammaproteobacteria bacterium]